MPIRKLIITSLLLLALSACDRKPQRSVQTVSVGRVETLLEAEQFIRQWALLIKRDDKGWSALDTLCSHDGCELSFQESALVCMCCGSIFDHDGHVVNGPAGSSLPYFAMSYRDEQLIVDTKAKVSSSARFTTPEIESALQGVRERIQQEAVSAGEKIPTVLLGGDPNESKAGMFREFQDLEVPSLSEELEQAVQGSEPAAGTKPLAVPSPTRPKLVNENSDIPLQQIAPPVPEKK